MKLEREKKSNVGMTKKKAMSSAGFDIEISARGARTLPLRQRGKRIWAKNICNTLGNEFEFFSQKSLWYPNLAHCVTLIHDKPRAI